MRTPITEIKKWLSDNGVIMYNDAFQFNGDFYRVEKVGSRFYTVHNATGRKGLFATRKAEAVYLTCSMALNTQSQSQAFIKSVMDAKFILCRANGSKDFYSEMPIVGQGEYLFSINVIDYIK